MRKYCERVVLPELGNQEVEPKYEFPTVVGLMSGENAPREVALTWLGWKVRTYELLGTPFDGPKDLLDPAVRAEAEEDIEICDAVTFQMDCSLLSPGHERSLSRAKPGGK